MLFFCYPSPPIHQNSFYETWIDLLIYFLHHPPKCGSILACVCGKRSTETYRYRRSGSSSYPRIFWEARVDEQFYQEFCCSCVWRCFSCTPSCRTNNFSYCFVSIFVCYGAPLGFVEAHVGTVVHVFLRESLALGVKIAMKGGTLSVPHMNFSFSGTAPRTHLAIPKNKRRQLRTGFRLMGWMLKCSDWRPWSRERVPPGLDGPPLPSGEMSLFCQKMHQKCAVKGEGVFRGENLPFFMRSLWCAQDRWLFLICFNDCFFVRLVTPLTFTKDIFCALFSRVTISGYFQRQRVQKSRNTYFFLDWRPNESWSR